MLAPGYSSLPRPGRPLAWAYAPPGELTEGRAALLPSPPQYANLPLHYATLGRAPRPRPADIPDILRTLSHGVRADQARVIVNELSGLEDRGCRGEGREEEGVEGWERSREGVGREGRLVDLSPPVSPLQPPRDSIDDI